MKNSAWKLPAGLVLGLVIGQAISTKPMDETLTPIAPVAESTVAPKKMHGLNENLEIAWKRLKRLELNGPLPDWMKLEQVITEPSHIQIVLLDHVFEWEKSDVKGETYELLDAIGSVMNEDPKITAVITASSQKGEATAKDFGESNLVFMRSKSVAEFIRKHWKIETARFQLINGEIGVLRSSVKIVLR